MIKENTGKKVLKRLAAFTLSTAIVVSTAFFGVPIRVKAADENTEYTVDVTANGDLMVSTSGGASVPMSNNGVMLWPGQKIVSTSVSFVEPNTMIRCHHFDGPPANIHNQYVGFTITSANSAVSLDDLGVLESDEADIVTGGTVNTTGGEQTDITMGKMPYDRSFTANKLVFVEYGKTNIKEHHTECDCPAHTPWDVYNYHQMSFKVHTVSVSSVNIKFDGFGPEKYPIAFDVSKNSVAYTYEVPTKIGYVFDGWEFRDSNGNIVSGVINDSKDGTLTFAGVDGSNWRTIDDLSKNGLTAVPKWKAKKLTINYDPNGGVYSSSVCTVTKDNVSYDNDKNNTSLFAEAKREGYTFDGWYLDNTRITCLADIPELKWNSSQTYDVKARWTLVKDPGYTIDSKTGYLTINSQDGFPKLEYGEYAKKVIVSEGITEIPDNALAYFDMEYVELPSTLKTIGTGAFSYCSSLKSITIPKGITEIKDFCFYDCRKIEKVVLPDSVVSIGTWAFCEAGSYLPTGTGATIRLSSQLKSIGERAFYEAKIAEINIPDSITTISDAAFGSAKIASFKMPSNVDKVPESMFAYSTLAEIDLTNVKAIEKKAFFNTEITSVTIPDSVTSIGPYAFACSRLQSVEIPENVTELDDGVFANCDQLESAKLPYGITSIPDYTFRNCTALKKLSLSNTIESIGYYAFDNVNIEEVVFAGTKEQWAALCETAEELKAAKVTYVEPVVPHVHDAKLVPEVAATCGKAGNKEYWICSDCKKVYADAEGKTETTVAKMTIPATGRHEVVTDKAVAPTLKKTGKTAGSHCKVCGKVFKAQKTIAKLLDISKVKVTGLTSKTYTGRQINPSLKVYYGKTLLKNGKDYTIKYGTNKSVGKGTVTISGKGKYGGKIMKTFKILPRKTTVSLKSSSRGKMTISYTKKSEAVKYKIQYADNSKFKKAKTKTVSAKTTKLTLSGKSKKTYYVRVSVIGKDGTDSGWSSVKKIKVK